MTNNINIKRDKENQNKKENVDQYKNQSSQMNVTNSFNNSSIIEQIKEEFEKELNMEFETSQDGVTRVKKESEKLIFKLGSNHGSNDNEYNQHKSKKHSASEQMLKLIKNCDIIYSKQRINNQDIDKLLKVSEDFIEHYYSNINKNELGEDFDWFAELSKLACVNKEKIKLIIKLSTRLNMLVCLADSRHFKEVVKFLDLDYIANMNNLDWKLLHVRMLNIYSCDN